MPHSQADPIRQPSRMTISIRYRISIYSRGEEKKKNHNNTTHEEKKSVFCWLDWLIFFLFSTHFSQRCADVDIYVNLTSYEKFSFFLPKNISLQIQPSYRQYLEFALKLGYPERLIQTALSRLGGSPTNNELLAELIKLGAQPGSNGESRKRKKKAAHKRSLLGERNERRSEEKKVQRKKFSFLSISSPLGFRALSHCHSDGRGPEDILHYTDFHPSTISRSHLSSLLMSFLLRFSPLFLLLLLSARAVPKSYPSTENHPPISRSSTLCCAANISRGKCVCVCVCTACDYGLDIKNTLSGDFSDEYVTTTTSSTEQDAPQLRPIVIDGSNIAMSHGNKEVFSCRGIAIAVDWFRQRGHRDICVFVPKWRKESARSDNLIKDQEILNELEKERVLVYTPSRSLTNGKRMVCYDDRYVLKLALENDGIVVSNDNYRDLVQESSEFKKIVEERILMYSFVNDIFMPPDDPLGKLGPSLESFLRFPNK